jgi:hypothetical protein
MAEAEKRGERNEDGSSGRRAVGRGAKVGGVLEKQGNFVEQYVFQVKRKKSCSFFA